MLYMEKTFTNIYENNVWGSNNLIEYKGSSGGGSSIELNKNTYVPFLKKFILDNNIKSVVDLGCGDFQCGLLIYDDLDIIYTGYDTYEKVIEYNSKNHTLPKYAFLHSDIFNEKENIIHGDLCILKDVLQHWSLEYIYEFLDYFMKKKQFKYILITNCCDQIQDNTDIDIGEWRNLSSSYLPLKKYNPKKLYNYSTKETCVIDCSQ